MRYTYSHIVTQIAKLYWKTIIFERYYSHNWRQRLQNVFLLENVLDILLSKALKRKKLPPVSENVNLLNKHNLQYESRIFEK